MLERTSLTDDRRGVLVYTTIWIRSNSFGPDEGGPVFFLRNRRRSSVVYPTWVPVQNPGRDGPEVKGPNILFTDKVRSPRRFRS